MAKPRLARPVRFTHEGFEASALPRETLLQALARRGIPLMNRSIKYHRPRGPFCGVGQCTGCLVRLNGVPNVRACRTEPKEGDVVRGELGWPSTKWDLLAGVDLLLPGHLDTLHGFRRPLALRPAYNAVVRRLTGTGRLPDPPTAGNTPPVPGSPPRRVDVLVVGDGPAGRALALDVARTAGLSVLQIDRRLERERSPPSADTDRSSSLPVEYGTSLVFLPPPGRDGTFTALLHKDGEPVRTVIARRVALTTGAYDGNLLFAGNDRPGVLTAEGALVLVSPGGRPPFSRALVVGGGERARKLLEAFRGQVAAVASLGEASPALVRSASEAGVPLHPNALLVEARGRRRVRHVLLRDRRRAVWTRIPVDAVLLAHRRCPNVPPFFQAGARMLWRAGAAAYMPEVDASGATSVPGLFAAGEVAGYTDPASIEASAQAAASGLLSSLGLGAPVPADPALLTRRVRESGPEDLLGYYRELLAQPVRGRRVVCPCEDVLLEELDESVHEGFTGMEVVKRLTGTGTGLCQGRYCLPDALLLLSLFEGRPPSEVGFITQRPPIWPTPLGALADGEAPPAEAPRAPA